MKYQTNVRFFWVESDRPEDGPGRGAWFWRDDDCDEDIGPFDSRAEAVRDYAHIRNAERPVSNTYTEQPWPNDPQP